MKLAMKRALLATCAVAYATFALAQDIRIGTSSEPTSMDPHFHNLTPNNQIMAHIFEPLISMDAKQTIRPGLAESWKVIDDTTWEFKLRAGVKFHDGSDFGVDDVIATWARAPEVPKSPSNFSAYIRGKTIEKVDDLTFRIKTAGPEPLMLNHLAQFGIISRKNKDMTTEDYNSGKAASGTGPFKFSEYVAGDRVVLTRNDTHWGGKPTWGKVTFKSIKSDPTRVAALLSGDVDVIENVPTADAQRIKKDARLTTASALSNRVIYFHLDRHRDTTPFIKGKDGADIKNPLYDLRVRQALSKALNRPAIVERVMEGEAEPASQFIPESYAGTSKNLKPTAYDLDGAKKLLAEAGLPNGFKITIHGPNGRYTNDAKILEAAGQMWARLGLDVSVEAIPAANFFSRASTGGAGGVPEFSLFLVGWSAGTGEPSDSVKALTTTFDRSKGTGSANRGRYSNPKVDELLLAAIRTVDNAKRNAMLAEATEIAMNDVAIIPIHYPLNTWAAKKEFTITPRSDEYTLATSFGRK
ncbi:MAG TPA: ABC transporter substrate-binding protein [Beijerinckiaceae bacterium]|nr:ABC transporter substrate-binding protein [Beijerinckiaceae bacterium]